MSREAKILMRKAAGEPTVGTVEDRLINEAAAWLDDDLAARSAGPVRETMDPTVIESGDMFILLLALQMEEWPDHDTESRVLSALRYITSMRLQRVAKVRDSLKRIERLGELAVKRRENSRLLDKNLDKKKPRLRSKKALEAQRKHLEKGAQT